MDFNLIITSFRGEQRELLRALKDKGKFKGTSFRDVITGFVDDTQSLMDELEKDLPLCLSRVIIINELFKFKDVKSLIKELKERILNYADTVKKYKSFRITVERRGHKGMINSHELEKELGEVIYEKTKVSVDLEEPEVKLVIELLDNYCGIALITKELSSKYVFIKA